MNRIKRDENILQIPEIITKFPEFTHKTTEHEIRERIEGKDHDLFVIQDNSKPAGFLVAYNLDEKVYYNWIMGVLPEFRRKGFGRQLIKQFESTAKIKGYTSVQVKTMEKFKGMQHLLTSLKYDKIGLDDKGKIILRKNL
ncbi:MAG: hypothetical protein B1H05_05120 [Candidatus Cloacimonas sp. 4484_140]|nr:MAG: hypothetical protein B1H05_05120 [Candidatus Cloacimonas sp. 4484_140]